MLFDITGKKNERTMIKWLKYNKKVRGTGDDWQFERFLIEINVILQDLPNCKST